MGQDCGIGEAFSLAGRVAVITGAASGFGREIARVLAEAGAGLVLSDVNIAGLEKTASMVLATGGTAVSIVADVAQRDAMETLADAALREARRLDIWVNSAGLPLVGPILEVSAEAADKVVAVNMMGTFRGAAAAARVMRSHGGGSIVNISSAGGDAAVRGLSIYSMTKAAVSHLTRIAALEFGAYGIRVNAVAPGFVETPMAAKLWIDAAGSVDANMREQVLREQAAASPLGINGHPSDIALAVLYLASDASRFVTGQVLRVNGGSSM